MEYPHLTVVNKDNPTEIDNEKLVNITDKGGLAAGNICFTRRREGWFGGKAVYLPEQYDWVIGRDDYGTLCLVPLKKMGQ